MELINTMRVSVPVDEAWAVLTDVERIAPCLPGAELQEVEGEEYRGVVRVKVGPITAQYKGKATFAERDVDGRRAVLRAEGRDTRGQGNANATITATLTPDGDGTRVNVVTDLTITGKVAQFGRGVLADVSAKLLQQFTDCLEKDLLVGTAATAAPATTTATPTGPTGAATTAAPPVAPTTEVPLAPAPEAREIESRTAEPVNLVSAVGAPVAKRAAPFVAVVFLTYWLFRRRRRARRR